MKWMMAKIGQGIIFLIGMMACCEVEKPLYLTPVLEVMDAIEITRNSAKLSCKIELTGIEEVSGIRCLYGISQEVEETLECDSLSQTPSVFLEGLKPNTTYYYCFEVDNGYSKVRSAMNHFTTSPTTSPSVGDLNMLGKGPISVMLQFDLLDDGGEDLLGVGFYIKEENGQEETVEVACEGKSFLARLGNLKQQTQYEIQGFAKNDIGETRTEIISVETEQSVVIVKAGTLKEIIGEENIFQFQELAVSGPLNGSDILILREMMGRGVEGNLTQGRMKKLDLTDASIENGGYSYDGNHYTKKNVLGTGMFAGCLFLEEIALPYGTIEIEKGAFDDCPELKTLCIPVMVKKVLPSQGCINLIQIDVVSNHQRYASYDGCLYSIDYKVLYWWPEGKTFTEKTFPEDLRRVEAYAFQKTCMKVLELPSSVEELGMGAFYGSQLESFVIPEKVTTVPTALFQQCEKLRTVYLGTEVGALSAYVFDGCLLEHLYVPVKDFLPMCHDEAFAGMRCSYEECVLHVPAGCKNMYRNGFLWSNFLQIKDDITD